jgi:hypothetical protein
MDPVQYFGIAQKISYLPSDDVASNDTYMKAMSTTLKSKHSVGILLHTIHCDSHLITLFR